VKLQAGQLASHLENDLARCYLVSGDEHLLVDEALDAIREAARASGFGARERHVASAGFDWSELGTSGANLSLFAERRLVELWLPTGKPGRPGSQAIVEFIERLDDDVMFVVSTPKLDKSTQNAKWVKALQAAGAHVPVWPIGARELPGWIADRMRRAGLRPERSAVRMIADRVEGNLLAAKQEIEKLGLLLGEGDVDAADVRDTVANSSRYDVFKLADAALAGDARRALRILSGLRAEGVEPVIVIWSLTRELRTLATLAERIAANADLGAEFRRLRVWQSRQSLVRSALGRHDRDGLYGLLKAAGRADAAAKGQGPGDAWQLAADIVLGLAATGKRAA
jgi:DNA polymerase-3 subunit delta